MDEPWAFDGPPTDVIAVTPSAVLLALDCSSTMIGWVVWDGAVRASGEHPLTGAIDQRCRKAYALIGLMIQTHPDIDVIAIESPVARYASAVIAQSRVAGAVLTRAALYELHVIEITPTEAKRALANKGNASKGDMQAAALDYYNVIGEHAADALGIALAAYPRVQVLT